MGLEPVTIRAGQHCCPIARTSYESAFLRTPGKPQARLIGQAVQIIQNGGVIAYRPIPAMRSVARWVTRRAGAHLPHRRIDPTHDFTLVCRDLSEISTYAR